MTNLLLLYAHYTHLLNVTSSSSVRVILRCIIQKGGIGVQGGIWGASSVRYLPSTTVFTKSSVDMLMFTSLLYFLYSSALLFIFCFFFLLWVVWWLFGFRFDLVCFGFVLFCFDFSWESCVANLRRGSYMPIEIFRIVIT